MFPSVLAQTLLGAGWYLGSMSLTYLKEVSYMRVELIYAPGCCSYKTVRETLETVIAEERLPIPVEMVEDGFPSDSPKIRIDGQIVENMVATIDHLRDILCGRWKELTEASLYRA